MTPCQNLLVIFLGWSYICGGCCLMLDKCFTGLKRKTELRELESAGNEDADVLLQETVSEHMQMLYDKYNRAGFHFKDGNTVRSFKAHWGTINSTEMQVFNLTPLTKSEDIMSVTLHYFTGGSQTSSARCAGLKACGRRGPGQAHIRLSIWSSTSEGNNTRTLGHATIRVPLRHGDSVSWQWKDITAIVMEAKGHNELLIGVEVPPEGRGLWSDLVAGHPPYILVYANDSDISGAESAVSALERRKDVPLERGLLQLGTHLSDSTAGQGRGRGRGRRRHRRSANVLLPLQNNELPESEYPYEGPRWDGPDPYSPAAKHPSRRPKKKPRKSRRHRVPLLQFDEQTVQQAQHRQWSESRSCSRRYLKVDFADIGWSEWIISPKSFDAYYCSGSCQFPMPKSLKPSNHATIQSIVRAVGVVPGIPEPCCVPEKMSPLSILFFDQDKNVVLKVYPNMTVDSCVCR